MDILSILAESTRSALGPIAAIYALAAIGLNLHFGYTGLLNFGQVGFMLVGAYGVGISVAVFDLPLVVGFGVGLLCAFVMALLLGIPTLRLRADYLSITTIAAAEVIRLVYRAGFAEPLTGGVYGLQNLASDFRAINPFDGGERYGFGALSYNGNHLWVLVVTWGLVLLMAGLTWVLMHSPWGRVIKGIREDEDAVRSLGKNVFAYKMQALVLGGLVGALAGCMLAVYQASIQPDQFKPQVTFFLWVILLLGGAGRVFGPVLGAMVFWFLMNFTDGVLQGFGSMGWLPFLDGPDYGAIQLAFVGLLLVLLIVFRPQGLIGDRKEMLINVK
ncbi:MULTISPECIES: branched-chain amino acid ABC transporter permease [Nocardiopsis]|uniref:Inner-membrane translocator n=1 Tax=Nocardiopsis dassonvillei (strain ATCC 23218 / DSM 43111 / CIP 107115 / JCM 7437 / KCTC 9190 / NBRC 14626 / NCTC 10488 / NRRL B-5397 / IMRU 509) TaxID=446468 RepID=D7B2A8_NOCDD|nr:MULTISPECIES: branched-chain amino acid ABC transporter permease [Nocardiopsis]ADH68565.1 inner-membrane translocator [Nocardiopsis dassonvillei subsp. dassonvillei DSM 43111]APC36644.1 branched-chain amino acid ABC transporter permease [Nocardiopsis dassonvillei]ASU59582.1 branched-chain amino acid ABC transporter permease [Nocardiopsis dassonvillei]NKY79820.1 branched-chain amino acid ABC transporter permease [Nocardiopsis dassonvillei]VEI89074.1 leucine/isoleucine/valine transporter perm